MTCGELEFSGGDGFFKHEPYSACFEDIVVIGCDRMRGDYCIPLS